MSGKRKGETRARVSEQQLAEVIYEIVETPSEESDRRLNMAFDLLFEATLRDMEAERAPLLQGMPMMRNIESKVI